MSRVSVLRSRLEVDAMNLLASKGRTTRCVLGRLAAINGAILSFAIFASQTAFGATSVLVGTNLTLVATADGSPEPTFQWRKNGIAIPSATMQTLSLFNVSTVDAASYQVIATNEMGSATSPEEVLTVLTSATPVPPTISTQPVASQSVAAGATVTLTVGASGYPTPSFQWQKDGVTILGATNSTLSLGPVVTNDSGTYVVVVSNTAGSVASNPAKLTVTDTSSILIAPSILAQPAPLQSLVAGSPASFSVTVAGSPTPSVQWKKDGTTISGATNATLSLSSVTTSDAGSYVAVATNTTGSISSAAAVLSVTVPTVGSSAPKIATQPVSQTVAAGAAVSFVVAASGSPDPMYQWRKNGTDITGATSTTLALNSVSTADAATYTVVATNTGGAVVSDSATLYVQSAPVITGQPVAQAVMAGSSAKFSATVSAIPGASLQWKKDGSSILGATSAVLLISSASTADVGKYKLVATNSLGSTTSDEVTLVIATAPIITSQPTSQSVSAKANVTFTVGATANPAPTFQWKKGGVALAGETKATLTLKSVNKSDAGDYVVEVRNAVGWVPSNRVTLSVANQSGRSSAEEDDPAIATPDGVAAGLVNLSVRANAGTGSNGLIVGFVVDGASSKSVLVRGVGPTLRDFGVSGVLLDPQLALYSGATVTASNDDWSSNENAAQIAGISARVGAFGLADRASDSALMATLTQGAYTVQLSGKESSTGVALVEVYDAAANSSTKLVNLSVRTFVGSAADAPNVGFVIAGTSPRRLLIRAVGPTLGSFGVTDAIADPQLELYRGTTRVDLNDNWGGSASLGDTFAQVGAFGLSDTASKDSVLLTTLEPGAYTVVVTGVNGAKGIGLVEVYDAP